jgi:hypothetical protein
MKIEQLIVLLLPAAAFSVLAYSLWERLRQHQRGEFIRNYAWPAGLLDKLEGHYPGFTRKETALVGNGLRQFFQAYLMAGRKDVAMPSQVADDLWHQFILYTRDYKAFCERAFGGFLHHTPAVVLSPERKKSNEGLRRVWWYSCKQENIDPRNPTRLPLLFALDAKFDIPNGYRYAPDCKNLRADGATDTYCGGDFGSSSVDGGTDGFGNSAGDGDSGDGGGDGGCGGGGGD